MTRKNMFHAVAGAILAFMGASSQAAHAAESFRSILFPTSVGSTAISGFEAGRAPTVKEPGSSAILSGIDMDEVGDKPCFIRAHWWRFTMEDLPQELTTTFNICSKAVDGDESAVFQDARETKTGVRAIQVCNNNQDNHRVKGVKLFGAFIDRNESGTVTSSGTTRSFERTNCNPPWKAVRECADGKVAVGLVIEHTDDEVTGLGLRCAQPVVKPGTLPDNAVSLFNEMEADIRVQVEKDGGTRTMTINEAIALHEVAGATVVVIDEGKVAVVRHYGMRNAKENLRTNGDTLYQAASISKLLGGLAMAKASRWTCPGLVDGLGVGFSTLLRGGWGAEPPSKAAPGTTDTRSRVDD